MNVFFLSIGEAGYITEVHHVTGEGRDGGLCYLEMMSNQHDPLEAANWALMSEIYGADSGYHYNYGGHCKEMRESCTLTAVRNFHTHFYHPKNFCLIVCGDLEPEEVFGVITPYIMSLGEDAGPPSFENPWKTEAMIEIEEEIETEHQYPAESEGLSIVKVALVNPASAKDVTLSTGIDILIQYLVYSPISPIHVKKKRILSLI
jgi:Zn-dependent M16 (insulinase) family peptidase